MTISLEKVKQLGRMSRLHFTQSELEEIQKYLCMAENNMDDKFKDVDIISPVEKEDNAFFDERKLENINKNSVGYDTVTKQERVFSEEKKFVVKKKKEDFL